MYRVLLISLLTIFSLGIGLYFTQNKEKKKVLPVINPIDLQEDVVDSSLLRVGVGHRIGDFEFTNQAGKKISLADIKGSVFVAEYFFTTCGTICPIMNQQMMRIQKKFKGNPAVKLLSFTVDPDVDDVEQIKNYAEGHEAVPGQWHFLTGDKTKLYEVARKSFFVLKPAEAENAGDAGGDFIHTNNFVLVDQELRIRGYYDGTKEKDVNLLMDNIELLLKEGSEKK